MMRTSFDFKVVAEDYDVAVSDAKSMIAKFMGITVDEVEDKVDLEIKVGLPKAETAAEVAEAMDNAQFVIQVFGSVKRSMAKPFGN